MAGFGTSLPRSLVLRLTRTPTTGRIPGASPRRRQCSHGVYRRRGSLLQARGNLSVRILGDPARATLHERGHASEGHRSWVRAPGRRSPRRTEDGALSVQLERRMQFFQGGMDDGGRAELQKQHSSGEGRLRPPCPGQNSEDSAASSSGIHIGPLLRAVKAGKAVQGVGGTANSRPIRCISRVPWLRVSAAKAGRSVSRVP